MDDNRPREIVLATRNPDKVEEIRAIFREFSLPILGLDAFTSVPAVEETGECLEENALLKARAAWDATGRIAMADDSGLFVDALNGRPGVRSSRFAGPDASYADNNARLLRLLEGIPPRERTARFACVVALVPGREECRTFRGEVEGEILARPRGEGGFGYDPLFYHPPSGRSFAELDREEKNRVSHRYIAFRKARAYLEHTVLPGP